MSERVYSKIDRLYARYRTHISPIPTDAKPQHASIGSIRVVLFDIYGTLLSSGSGDVGTTEKAARASVFQKALEDGGTLPLGPEVGKIAESYYYKEIEDSHRSSIAAGIDYPEVDIILIWRRVLERLKEDSHVSTEVSGDLCENLAIIYELMSNPVTAMPGARETLDRLAAQFMLGIVSNAQFYTSRILEIELGATIADLGFRHDLCVFSYTSGRAKPSSEMFSPILGRIEGFGILPSEVLYVGNDMLNDVFTAHKAGCRTCLFSGDGRSLRLRSDDSRCANLSPDVIITEISQLWALLSSQNPNIAEETSFST